MHGIITHICIAPVARGPMQEVQSVQAITGAGLQGDRYSTGEGSYNRGKSGKRQVTLFNTMFLEGSGFTFPETRRNIGVCNAELMWLIGREFPLGEALLRGVKYCDPCHIPSKLSGKSLNFREVFFDRGGLVAEVIEGGIIRVGAPLIPPKREA